ncbi:hypothetical protein CONPUDRAFT_144158 [Coniophora puteana RWD-64-598 SS2]|uniref:Uncharacterized protein n=1 Tax=Coniophora puteana (strain RWD-64-598) TaxID=741705 RepID=A0A5M3MQ81_CONPW|nr:uncharacterized protein CONPUDRAFT_144158 [Coniophora puteana RWD-64-598 SS2]EIW81342.1 hypothetical protein CONPUDRAFT_144158 [Coniophora puteana RWD-64-598 SS2]
MTSSIQSPSQWSPRGSLFSIVSFTCSAVEFSFFYFVNIITTSVEFIAGVLDICRLSSPLALAVVLSTLNYICSIILLCAAPIRTLKSAAHALVALVSSLVSSLSKRRTVPADPQPTQARPVTNKPRIRPFSVGKVSSSKERPSTYHEAWKVQKHESSSSQARYPVVQENGTQPRSQVTVVERESQARQRKPRGTLDHQRRRSQNVNMVRYLVSEKARLQKAIEDLKAQTQVQDGRVASMSSKGTSPRATPSLTLTNVEGHTIDYFDGMSNRIFAVWYQADHRAGQHGSGQASSAEEREKLESKITELSKQLEAVLSDKEQLESQLKSSKQTCLRCQDSTLSAPHTCEGASSRAESRGAESQREVFSEPEEYRPIFAPNDEMANDEVDNGETLPYDLETVTDVEADEPTPQKPSEASFKSSDPRRVRSEDAQPSSASQAAEYASLGNGVPSLRSKQSFRKKIFHRSTSPNSVTPEPSVVDKPSPSRSPSMLMSKVRRLTNRRASVRSPSE